MSYGPKQSAIGERAADLVARILRGARPADLPLELPTHFEFLDEDLKTAQALERDELASMDLGFRTDRGTDLTSCWWR